MNMAWDTASGWFLFVVAAGIVTIALVAIDAVMLIHRRKTGRFANLATWIDTILLMAGVPVLAGLHFMTRLFESVARESSMNIVPLLVSSTLLVQTCGFLFIASFYAWAVLRLLYNRAVAGTVVSPGPVQP